MNSHVGEMRCTHITGISSEELKVLSTRFAVVYHILVQHVQQRVDYGGHWSLILRGREGGRDGGREGGRRKEGREGGREEGREGGRGHWCDHFKDAAGGKLTVFPPPLM